jgi:CspA family cold shock protein
MPVGRVKWFDCKKGYGFILDEAGREVFVHYTVIQGDGFRRLRDGEVVEYEVSQGPKGFLAEKVKRVAPPGAEDAAAEAAPARAKP